MYTESGINVIGHGSYMDGHNLSQVLPKLFVRTLLWLRDCFIKSMNITALHVFHEKEIMFPHMDVIRYL